jgi:glutamate dehydrogenase (NAD(P)+)
VTGKPLNIGGSQGRTEATGRGVIICMDEALRRSGHNNPSEIRVAIQGFGNVGTYAAKHAFDLGYKVVAISDVTGGYYNAKGLDIDDVMAYTATTKHNVLEGYSKAEKISNEQLLTIDCDVLAPCAMENQITEKNAANVKAFLIVEGANGPTTPEADDILFGKGIDIIPDILANAGGVTVSYFEWVQGLQSFFWDVDEVNRQLRRVLIRAYDEVMNNKNQFKVDTRTAAQLTAIKRVADATKTRGIYP